MILDTLVGSTMKRVAAAKDREPYNLMKKKALSLPASLEFRFENALKSKEIAFICEVKKASPSKGLIAADFPYLTIAKEYETAGASAVSVLTEPEFFQGSNAYLTEISRSINIPVLRKDFMVDDYQLYEAKVIGADAVLLICALLDTGKLKKHLSICDELGLSALVEAHTKAEVYSALQAGARIIGVNNRNLKTFAVDLNTSIELRPVVPPNVLFVAESGIHTIDDINALRQAGVDAVLIGETLMRSADKKEMLAQLRGEII